MATPDRKQVKADLEVCDRAFTACWYIAAVFVLLGVIGEIAHLTLLLEPISWFLLVIATLLAAIAFRIGWAVSWYLTVSK